jgi:hypothetical protein
MTFGLLRPSRVFWFFLFLWSVILTLVVYGRSLTLPFFFDDLLLLPYAAETSLPQLWREPAVFPYFRPLPVTFWRLSYLAWGGHQPVWLHGVNLLLHALNGWLLAYLGARLFNLEARKPDYQTCFLALISVTLYLIFPFHFQAVPWISAIYHLAVATFIMGSVIAYLQYRQSGRFRWALLGGALTLAALFTQENGVLILPLVLILEIFFVGERRVWRSWAALLPWAAPLAVWLPIWLLTPRTTSEMALNNLETIGQNGSWLIQGAAFPLTWVGGWLRDAWGWNDLGAALVLSLLGLGGVAIAQARGYNTPLSRFAWIWCALGGLVALLLLPFAYLLSSPRLLTLMAVGAAWLWGELLTHLLAAVWQKRRQRIQAALTGALAVALLLLAVVPAYIFLQRQMTFHTMLGQLYWQLTAEVTAANASGNKVVAINLPAHIGRQPIFALGHEGVVFAAAYIPPATIVTAQTGAPANFSLLRYEDIRPQTDYMVEILGAGQNWPDLVAQNEPFVVLQANYEAETISLRPAGEWLRATAELPGAAVSSGDLAEFRLDPTTSIWLDEGRATADGDHLRIDLVWRIDQPPPYSVTVFVHAIGADGGLVGQADGYPWARTYPMGQWPPGATVKDTRIIPVTAEARQVYVGLYDSLSGERLAVFFDGSHADPDNLLRLTVEAANQAE